MQRLHVGVLDLVGAVDLLGDELGVVDDLDLVGAELARAVEPEQQPAVLRDVVRGDADRLARLVEHLARGRRDIAPAAAGPGLPRAPPSTWTTTFTAGLRRATLPPAREVARHAGAAAVADLALLDDLGVGAGGSPSGPRLLRRSDLRRSTMTVTLSSSA